MSNRDKSNLMERLGALPSAQAFSNLAVVCNKLMHDYPEEMKKHLERLNFITSESSSLVEIFLGIARYAEKFGFHVSIEKFHHLRVLGTPSPLAAKPN